MANPAAWANDPAWGDSDDSDFLWGSARWGYQRRPPRGPRPPREPWNHNFDYYPIVVTDFPFMVAQATLMPDIFEHAARLVAHFENPPPATVARMEFWRKSWKDDAPSSISEMENLGVEWMNDMALFVLLSFFFDLSPISCACV